MKKDCDKFKADITDYARGEYKYIKDYDALFNHLRECADCRTKLFELEDLFFELRPPYKPSPEFTKRMAELREMFKKGPPPLTEEQIAKSKEPLAKGIELYKRRKWAEAVKVFDEAVRQSPKDANTYYHRGLAEKKMNRLDEALKDFSRAIELDPDDADAYFHHGEIYQRWGEGISALRDYARAIQLNPDYAEAYDNRGWIYGGMGKYQEAILNFNKAIELIPDKTITYQGRGLAYGILGEVDKAISDFSKALKLSPKYVNAYYNRGVAYAHKDELKKAITDFRATLKLEPNHQFALDNLRKAEQQFLAREIEAKLKKIEKQIAERYKKDKKRLKAKYEAEIKQLTAKVKMLEDMNKQLLDALTGERPEYTYQTPVSTMRARTGPGGPEIEGIPLPGGGFFQMPKKR